MVYLNIADSFYKNRRRIFKDSIDGTQAGRELLNLFAKLSTNSKVNLDNADDVSQFLELVKEEFNKARKNPIMLHGHQTQALFEAVAVSLGKCDFIKVEDAGNVYYQKDTNIRPPDLRIKLNKGDEIFVEVKNKHKGDFEVKKLYLDSLKNYANLFKRDLFFAIYWSKSNIWTLITPDKLTLKNAKYVITWSDAQFYNEMYRLGDMRVGTIPPFTFKIFTDPEMPRIIQEEGFVEFIIKAVELYGGGKLIRNEIERNIAFYFLLFSDWLLEDTFLEIIENELIAIVYTINPDISASKQNFQLLGSLSSIIIRHYQLLTAPEGNVETINPKLGLKGLGVKIPDNYKGVDLKLWFFIQMPSEPK